MEKGVIEMEYLLLESTPTPKWCLIHEDCTCDSTGCYKKSCTTNTCVANRGDICPKHCWAQLCNTAKVDPFSVTV